MTRQILPRLLLLLIPSLFSVAQETSSGDILLILSRVPGSEEVSVAFQGVVEDTVSLELSHVGLVTAMDEEAEIFDESGRISIDRVLGRGRQANTGYVLTAIYNLKGSEIQMTFSLYGLAEGQLLETVTKRGEVDLMLDAVIGAAIGEILEKVELKSQEPAVLEEVEDEIPEAVEGPPPPTEEIELEAPSERRRHFELTVGAAPFLTVGQASEYFKIGFLPSLYGTFLFPLPEAHLGLGIYAGFNSFRATGVIASSLTYLIPIGIDFRYSSGYPLGLYLHLSGGPAILSVDPNETGRLTKLVAYLLAGIGLQLSFTEGFGLALDTSFSVFFERVSPIMGYTPSLYLFLRF